MGISIWQLLILLAVVILIGTKKLRNIGGDLGGALKSFRKAMKEGEDEDTKTDKEKLTEKESGRVIEGEVSVKEKDKV